MKMYWSTRRHRTKLLSLLCALAIFASLIPAASAASSVSEDVLKKNVVSDTVTPAGIQINLFDYWVAGRDKSDSGTDYKTSDGINQGHDLRFLANGDRGSGGTRINQYTGSNGGVRSGIVQNRLSGGYPVLKSGNNTGLEANGGLSRAQSLDYLFDKTEEITNKDGSKSGTLGKKTFWDVDGLLQVDENGYYYFTIKRSAKANLMNPPTTPALTRKRTPLRSTIPGASTKRATVTSKGSSSRSIIRRRTIFLRRVTENCPQIPE